MVAKPYDVRLKTAKYAIIELMGGDNNLSDFVEEDMSEMAAGIGSDTAVVTLSDVFNGGARVTEISLEHGAHVLEDLGEIDTGDPAVLARVVARALKTYTGKIAIGFWDHGTGVFDDYDRGRGLRGRGLRLPRNRRPRSRPARHLLWPRTRVIASARLRAMLHDDQSGGLLTNIEARKMLTSAFKQAGRVKPVELLFSDTCLNGMAEVAEELGSFAQCIVGSETLEPGDGWDYEEWLGAMRKSPPKTAAAWAQQAVTAMKVSYAPRTEEHPVTLAAISSSNTIATKFKALVATIASEDAFAALDLARARTQQFDYPSDTFDMVDFTAKIAAGKSKPPVKAAAAALGAAVKKAVIANTALGSDVANAHGLAFWFPSSQSSLNRDIEAYEGLAWEKKTGWAKLLKKYR